MAFQTSSIALAPVATAGKDKLEPRLLALVLAHGVEDVISNAMRDNGLTTCSLLKHMCPAADSVTEMLREDPFRLTGTDFATKMKIGKMRAVWEASQVTDDVEVRHNAERLRQNLPPETTLAELEAVAKLFAKTHWELERVKCPSNGFFERLMLQVQTMFSVIDYSRVTN